MACKRGAQLMHLLIRPAIASDEGLRAYVCRLATRNLSASLFRPMLLNFATATSSVPELARLTDEAQAALLRRGSLAARVGRQAGGVRFGDVILPRKVVHSVQRRVCPKCIESDGIARCAWELRAYDICDRHGLRLVDTCGGCRQPLCWTHPSIDRCACGFPLAQLKAKSGSNGRRRLCRILASSMIRSINDRSAADNVGCGRELPIDWALILCEFISAVVLPNFSEEQGLQWSKRYQSAFDGMTASMLEDHQYRDYLRDEVFMHASADPMTLVNTLRPGGLDEWRLRRGAWCWTQLCFHQCLWDFKLATDERTARRAPSVSLKRPARTVARKRSRRLTEILQVGEGPINLVAGRSAAYFGSDGSP